MDILFNFPYITEILTVTILAIVIAITPGLDFMLITRNSIFHSRKAGVYSAIGIACSLWVHVAYSIAGLAALISQSALLFSVIKYMGAAYLIYIGCTTFFTSSKSGIPEKFASNEQSMSGISALKMGFFCNLLNPKAPIFFLSIFTQIVNPDTPLWLQATYGAIISVAHLVWFSLVAIFLSQPAFLQTFNTHKVKLEKTIGVLLVGFGCKLATADR